MRLTVYFIFLILISCSPSPQKKRSQSNALKPYLKTNTSPQVEEKVVDFRQSFISLYKKPILVDTAFYYKGEKYRVIFHHFCTMDNDLVVPAKYNFDTKKDFVTHNFVSDLIVLSYKDTVFKKHITKSTFNNLLDTIDLPLKQYGTLLYPTLSIKNDSIQIHYNISIPVTDVGIGVDIKFDRAGNYVIEQ